MKIRTDSLGSNHPRPIPPLSRNRGTAIRRAKPFTFSRMSRAQWQEIRTCGSPVEMHATSRTQKPAEGEARLGN